MTIKLYETDGHIKEFDAVVTECELIEDNYLIQLDQTAFFPEGGGQMCDTGTINGIRITNVQTINGRIYHYGDKPLNTGDKIHGVVDWEKRFRNMQNHSGEHIFSGIINKLYGLDNIGFHLGEEDVTMDYSGILTKEQIKVAETMANNAVFENIPIICEIPSEEILSSISYRSKLELTENVRIVTIPGYDVCACCAPHVKNTGEIGLIKIIDSYRQNQHTRLRMLCGKDALEYYRMLLSNIDGISQLLSSKHYNSYEATEILLRNYNDCKQQLISSNKKLALAKADSVLNSDNNICLFENNLDNDTLRIIVNKLLEKTNKISSAFSGDDVVGYNFISASNSVDLKETAINLRQKLAAKCGGSSTMIQGHINSTRTEIEAFFY